jgi:hypothetical protein
MLGVVNGAGYSRAVLLCRAENVSRKNAKEHAQSRRATTIG